MRIETRKRVQTNEAKSKRRRASPTQTTSQRDNTPASRCLPSRRVLLARKGNRQPITPQGLQGWRAHPKKWPCQGHQPQQWCERTRHPCWRGMEHAWDPQGCAARPAKKIEGVEPHPIIPCVYYVLPRACAPAGFPNLLTSPPWSNPANRPGPQTMPECRFNKYNATSKK